MTKHFVQCLVFLGSFLCISHSQQLPQAIYVRQNAENADCLNTSQSKPCNNLTAALEFMRSSSIVYIFNGSYHLLPSARLVYTSMKNIGITSMKDTDSVNIICSQPNTGLSFHDSIDIRIKGITFSGCGTEHNSTTRNFKISPELSLLTVNVSLYFELCAGVSLTNVTVQNSLGLAVQFYSTSGVNTITSCMFLNNPFKNVSNNTWGGGLYIEFPFCSPGDNSCGADSAINISSVSNSLYTISDSIFDNNKANSVESGLRLVLPYKSYHTAAGRGGGLSIFFKGNAQNNAFEISNCKFLNNEAVYGGGLYIEMQDSAYNNSVVMDNLTVSNNQAQLDAGGLLASYLFLQTLENQAVNSGRICIRNSEFFNNSAVYGGGAISYSSTRQRNQDTTSLNKFSMTNITFDSNQASIGAAMQISAYAIEVNGLLSPVLITNLSVINNTVQGFVIKGTKNNKKLGSGAMYVQEIPIVFSGSINFHYNSEGTGLVIYHSSINVTQSTDIQFCNNTGHTGGALALHSSYLSISNDVKFLFIGNEAYIRGGALYAEYSGPDVDMTSLFCVIQYHDITKNPKKWNASFVFQDNKLLNGNQNSIYVTSLLPCLWGRKFGFIPTSSNMTLFDLVFCWNQEKKIWRYDGRSDVSACKEHIDTGINHFKLSLENIKMIPGKVTELKVNEVDDQNENVSSTVVFHVYSKTNDISVHRDYEYISSKFIKILKKPSSNAKFAELTLETVGLEVNIEITINVTVSDCPPGFALNKASEICECDKTFSGILQCDGSSFVSKLLGGFWIGIDDDQDGKTVVSHCRNCNNKNIKDGYFILNKSLPELESDLCGKNRNGLLCSNCVNGTAPAINLNSFECVHCTESKRIGGVFVFILLDVFFPLALIIGLYILDVPLTNGLLHGPIFFAQMMTTVVSLDADGIIQYQDIVKNFNDIFQTFYVTVYDVFNLEFFMFAQNICIGSIQRYAAIVSLHYITAFIPLAFVFFFGLMNYCFDGIHVYQTANKFKNCMRSGLKNVPNLLATCILLSYTKVAVIASYLLTPIALITPDSGYSLNQHSVLYIDGGIHFLSKQHYGYFIGSLLVVFLFLIPIPLCLILFRSNDPENNFGFFNNLINQFQKEMRQEKNNETCCFKQMCEGKHKESEECCDSCKVCGREVQNRTEYGYECCTTNYLCAFSLKKSRLFKVAVNMSFSFHDFRWVSGGFFVLRILLVLPYTVSWTTVIRYSLQLCICMFGGIFIMLVKPYRRDLYKNRFDCNKIEALSLFNLAFVLALCIYQYHYTTSTNTTHSLWVYMIQIVLVVAPFIWIVYAYMQLLRDTRPNWMQWCCGTPDRRDNNLGSVVDDNAGRNGSETIPLTVSSNSHSDRRTSNGYAQL